MSRSPLRRVYLRACSTVLLGAMAMAAPACRNDAKKDQPAPASKDAGSGPKPDDQAAGNDAKAGQWYHAWISGPPEIGDVPFFMQLPARPQRGSALFAHGSQRVEAEARWYGAEVSVNQQLMRTRMFLREGEGGALEGHMMSRSPVVEGTVSMPMRATPVPEPDDRRRFPDLPSCGPRAADAEGAPDSGQASGNDGGAAAEPWGRWLASFETWGAVELGLEQVQPGVARASFAFEEGTVQVMYGNVFGNRVCVSGFDGVNALLAVLDLEPDGQALRGYWAVGPALERRAAFTAEKRDQVGVTPNLVRFTPNRTKVSLFELGLPQYRNKPVIVEFGASWCPPCLDSAPVLRELYAQHHDQGLEIVTLLFEQLDDEDALRRNAQLFVEQHEIPWQVIPVRGEITPYWDIVPHDPAAVSVNLPVTIFVNPDGTIRDAHTGFPSPESGKQYQDMVERYRRVAAELVAAK